MSKVPQCQEIWQDNLISVTYYIVGIYKEKVVYITKSGRKCSVGSWNRNEFSENAHYVGTSRIAPDDLFERINYE